MIVPLISLFVVSRLTETSMLRWIPLLLSCLPRDQFSEVQALEFARSYGQLPGDQIVDAISHNATHTLLLGHTTFENKTDSDLFLHMVNELGEVTSSQSLDSTVNDMAKQIIRFQAGYILAFSMWPIKTVGQDIGLIYLSESLGLVWASRYGADDVNELTNIHLTRNGELYLVGRASHMATGPQRTDSILIHVREVNSGTLRKTAILVPSTNVMGTAYLAQIDTSNNDLWMYGAFNDTADNLYSVLETDIDTRFNVRSAYRYGDSSLKEHATQIIPAMESPNSALGVGWAETGPGETAGVVFKLTHGMTSQAVNINEAGFELRSLRQFSNSTFFTIGNTRAAMYYLKWNYANLTLESAWRSTDMASLGLFTLNQSLGLSYTNLSHPNGQFQFASGTSELHLMNCGLWQPVTLNVSAIRSLPAKSIQVTSTKRPITREIITTSLVIETYNADSRRHCEPSAITQVTTNKQTNSPYTNSYTSMQQSISGETSTSSSSETMQSADSTKSDASTLNDSDAIQSGQPGAPMGDASSPVLSTAALAAIGGGAGLFFFYGIGTLIYCLTQKNNAKQVSTHDLVSVTTQAPDSESTGAAPSGQYASASDAVFRSQEYSSFHATSNPRYESTSMPFGDNAEPEYQDLYLAPEPQTSDDGPVDQYVAAMI